MSDITPSKDFQSANKFCVPTNMMPVDTFKEEQHVYSTVKYTDDTRVSRKEKLEWKIHVRRDTVGYDMSHIDWIIAI